MEGEVCSYESPPTTLRINGKLLWWGLCVCVCLLDLDLNLSVYVMPITDRCEHHGTKVKICGRASLRNLMNLLTL